MSAGWCDHVVLDDAASFSDFAFENFERPSRLSQGALSLADDVACSIKGHSRRSSALSLPMSAAPSSLRSVPSTQPPFSADALTPSLEAQISRLTAVLSTQEDKTALRCVLSFY